MQLRAHTQQGIVIFARDAQMRCDYFCPECGGVLRIRQGLRRRRHFFHLKSSDHCRQAGRGLIHLLLQEWLVHLLPGDVEMEWRAPAIGRIADVVWHNERLLFEIQCSPIQKEELLARTRDWQEAGYQVVWLLHLNRFGKESFGKGPVQEVELLLEQLPHYFTNWDEANQGMIFDRGALWHGAHRRWIGPPLPIDLTKPRHSSYLAGLSLKERRALSGNPLVKERIAHWPVGFGNDLLDCSMLGSSQEAADCFEGKERQQEHRFSLRESARFLYRSVLRLLLEEASR